MQQGSPGLHLLPYFRELVLADRQSPKVGKTEKTEPAVSRRKSPNQRRYKGVRWHGVQ